MKTNSKFKSLFLFILFVIVLFLPQTVFAASEDDPLEYSINSYTREVSIKGCDISAINVVIPSEYRGYKVTSIEASAFSNCSNLESIIIPDSIEYIGYGAFSNCSSLTSIEIPDSVTEIRHSTFSGCTNLKDVKLNAKITVIPDDMFYSCTSLNTFNLPDSVLSIGRGSFYNCTSLETMILPNKLEEIGYKAFAKCTKLKNMDLPSSVTILGGAVFQYCTNLTSVKIPSSVIYFSYDIESYNGDMFYNASPDLVLQVVKASKAEDYAINYSIDYEIYAYPISVCEIAEIPNQTYTGSAIKPTVSLTHTNSELSEDEIYSLVEGVDYTLSYQNNIKTGTGVVTIKGIGKYEQTTNVPFKILPKSITSATVSGIVNKVYSTNLLTQSITVRDGNTLLKNGTDYTVSYQNNRNVGTATVIIQGRGNYSGTITKTFQITPKNIAQTKVASITNKGFTGYYLTPALNIKDGYVTLREGTDYILSYKNNKNIGTATVTIKGIKNYYGTITRTFKIIPPKATGLKTKKRTTTSLTVSWSKKSGISGYEVFMAVRKSGTYSKIKTITKTSTTSLTKSGLTPGKTYYFKVRTYKVISGKKVYGDSSSILTTSTSLKTPTIKKVSPSYYTATVNISKVSGATGYEIYLKYKNTYYRYLGDTYYPSCYLYNLSSSTKYSLKIRAFKVVDNRVIYSPYSKVKTFTTKKY